MAMTIKQKVFRLSYPLIMRLTKTKKTGTSHQFNKCGKKPSTSFHNLSFKQNCGEELPFEVFRGRKVLIVNTATDCAFTTQFKELVQLHESYNYMLDIIAFPANDFKQQERGSDDEIANFCKVNFGVSFPIMKKSVVKKNENQNPVYNWLSHSAKNGWNNQSPSWNFSKYLINEDGILTDYFGANC